MKPTKAEINADQKARALYTSGAFQLQIEQARARFKTDATRAAFDAAIFDEQKKRYGMEPGGKFTAQPATPETPTKSYPLPGATKFSARLTDEQAFKIAHEHYGNIEQVVRASDSSGEYHGVRLTSGWVALIGVTNGKPAILHKRPDGTRELETVTIPQTHCAECGNAFPVNPPNHTGGTGYAVKPDGTRICYACADKAEREALKDRSKPFVGYVSGDGSKITTWTGGELMRVTSETDWQMNFGFRNVGVCISAIDCHGERWHGRGAGRGMCITLRASKPAPTPKPKFPRIGELKALFVALKKDIGDDYRASDEPDDSTPAMQVTIGANEKGEWNYQTGDNSYTGGAYSFPHWAVVTLERRSNSTELAREVVSQLGDLMAQ